MKMRTSKMLSVITLAAIVSALDVTATPKPEWTTKAWTTGQPGVNLNGKMFTLSSTEAGISFFPPYYSPRPSAPPSYTTHSYYTTTYPPWTTPPAFRGLSVCLRYLNDMQSDLFTLSPNSRDPLTLHNERGSYTLMTRQGYMYIPFEPSIRFGPEAAPDIWTRVCIVIDSMKNVAQLFSGSRMSIRKMTRYKYVWPGEPVIDIPGFDGQVTDIQVWDYPLRYREIINYMNTGAFRLYRGSVLTWSDISFSLRGQTLMEDVYEIQARQPVGGRGRGRRLRGDKRVKLVFGVGESKDGGKQQL